MSRNNNSSTPAIVKSNRELFGTEEGEALARTQVQSFLAHTNNQAVVNELEVVLKSVRDLVGWRNGGRLLLEEIKNSAFAGAGKDTN